MKKKRVRQSTIWSEILKQLEEGVSHIRPTVRPEVALMLPEAESVCGWNTRLSVKHLAAGRLFSQHRQRIRESFLQVRQSAIHRVGHVGDDMVAYFVQKDRGHDIFFW